jgi:hypothetical protein
MYHNANQEVCINAGKLWQLESHMKNMPVKEVVLCHAIILELFFRYLSVYFYKRKWKCCIFMVLNAAAKYRFFYVWNESVRKRLVDDIEFCVFHSVMSCSTMGWYMVSLLQQLRIFYKHTVAVWKDMREIYVTGISSIWITAPLAFLVSWNWVAFLERDGRYKNYVSLIVITKIHASVLLPYTSMQLFPLT